MNSAKYKLVLLFLVNLCSVFVWSAAVQRSHRKDVCEATAQAFDPKIICYCTGSTREVSDFRKADCWLHGNSLSEADAAWDGFGRHVTIKELSLVIFADENFDFWPQKVLSYLMELTKFHLVHGNISTIHSYAFSKLNKLEDISLVNNNIQTIEDYAFMNIDPHLKSLNLSFNQITHIDRHVFYKNSELRLLHLVFNNITTIADRAFGDQQKLVELRLDYNMIKRITSNMLFGLSSLEKLTLAGNYIQTIDKDTFEHTPAIEFLDLAQNSLEWIAPNALKGTNQLKYIDLEQNLLKQLDANLFHSIPGLQYLNIGRNQLSTFEVDRDGFLIERFLHKSHVMLLHENNLVCDCRLLWLYELRNRTRSGIIQKILDDLNCELREPHRTEQVFLLRLEYQNFDCDAAPASSPVDTRRPNEMQIRNVKSTGLRFLNMGNSLFHQFVATILLLLCYYRY